LHDFYELFSRFWWLMFPVYWMVIHAIRSSRRSSSQDHALEVLRTYAARGEQPPPEVLKALTQLSHHPDDDDGMGAGTGGVYQASRQGGVAGAWWTFFVFLALTGGFAVGVNGFSTDGGAHTAFLIVTVVMAFLAVGSFIMAITATFRRKP